MAPPPMKSRGPSGTRGRRRSTMPLTSSRRKGRRKRGTATKRGGEIEVRAAAKLPPAVPRILLLTSASSRATPPLLVSGDYHTTWHFYRLRGTKCNKYWRSSSRSKACLRRRDFRRQRGFTRRHREQTEGRDQRRGGRGWRRRGPSTSQEEEILQRQELQFAVLISNCSSTPSSPTTDRRTEKELEAAESGAAARSLSSTPPG